jgi:ABC-2 type transport system permease protein
MTILGPILIAAIGILPAYFASLPEEDRSVMVLDKANLLRGNPGKEGIQLKYLGPPENYDLEEAKEQFLLTEDYALLYIPTGSAWDPDFIAQNVAVYGQGDVALNVKNYLEDLIRNQIQNDKLRSEGVDPEVIAQTKTSVDLRSFNLEDDGEEQETVIEGKMVVGLAFSFFMYFFIFIFGSQVMMGVLEEKGSRIIEVIVSSVKPFQLMMGKILGVGLVGLTQFLIWVVFSSIIYTVFTGVFLADKMEALEQVSQMDPDTVKAATDSGFQKMTAFMDSLNIPLLIGSFLFYFLGGFFLYSALFAAIGSAVESQTESQQFMMPVTMPIIISIIVAMQVAENPDGPLAFWFSMIPLTSPIVMVARIPFGVPTWELILSMLLLIGGFIGTTWIAARIYRTGILMYGQKVNWAVLWKWLRHGH